MKPQKSQLKSFNLPDNIANTTIGDLMRSNNAEIHAKNGNVSLRASTNDGTFSFQYNAHNTGRQTAKLSSVPSRAKKMDYIDDISEMLNSGMKQKDIAFELGMSPAYVNQLIKKYNL